MPQNMYEARSQITASSESGIGTEITLDLSSNDMLTE